MIRVYGISNCNNIRKTKAWLEEREAEYEFIDVRKHPMSAEELADVVDKVGLDVVLNKRGTTWRRLGMAGKDPGEQELFDLLLENQVLIKRPLIIKGEAVLVGDRKSTRLNSSHVAI